MKRRERVRDAVPARPGGPMSPETQRPSDPILIPGEPVEGGRLSRWALDSPLARH